MEALGNAIEVEWLADPDAAVGFQENNEITEIAAVCGEREYVTLVNIGHLQVCGQLLLLVHAIFCVL